MSILMNSTFFDELTGCLDDKSVNLNKYNKK